MNYINDIVMSTSYATIPTAEEALSNIAVFSSTGEFIDWKANAKDLLGIDPKGYIVTIDGKVLCRM